MEGIVVVVLRPGMYATVASPQRSEPKDHGPSPGIQQISHALFVLLIIAVLTTAMIIWIV